MAPPNINIRGIRQTIPPGTIMGRQLNAGSGPPQLLTHTDLNAFGLATHSSVAAAIKANPASGTVTSVAVGGSTLLSFTGSPITTSGTIDINFAVAAVNKVFAGPGSGSSAAPTFRSLVVADIPSGLPYDTSGAAATAQTNAESFASALPYISYGASQTLTSAQQLQAQSNLGISGGSGGVVVQNGGTTLGTATTINFTGSGQSTTFSGSTATVAISGGGGGGGGFATETAWTPPVLSAFTSQNFGGSTATATPAWTSGIRLTDPGTQNGMALRKLLTPIGSTHWQATLRMRRQTPIWDAGVFGICAQDSSNGRSILFGPMNDGSNSGIGRQNYVSDTSIDTTVRLGNNQDTSPDIWLRVQFDGTSGNSLPFSFSYDGDYFGFLYDGDAFILGGTVDKIGFGFNANNSAITLPAAPYAMDVYSWEIVALP